MEWYLLLFVGVSLLGVFLWTEYKKLCDFMACIFILSNRNRVGDVMEEHLPKSPEEGFVTMDGDFMPLIFRFRATPKKESPKPRKRSHSDSEFSNKKLKNQ